MWKRMMGMRLGVKLYAVAALYGVPCSLLGSEYSVVGDLCGGLLGDRTEIVEHPDLFGRLAQALEGKKPGLGGVVESNGLYYRPAEGGARGNSLEEVYARLMRTQQNIDLSAGVGKSIETEGLSPHSQFASPPEELYWALQRVGVDLSPKEAMSQVDEGKVNREYGSESFFRTAPLLFRRLFGGLITGSVVGLATTTFLCFGTACDPNLAAGLMLGEVGVGGALGFYLGKRAVDAKLNDPDYVKEQRSAAQNRVFFRDASNHRNPTNREEMSNGFAQDWNQLSEHAFRFAGGGRWEAPSYYSFVMESPSKNDSLLIVVRFPRNRRQGLPEVAYSVEEKQ